MIASTPGKTNLSNPDGLQGGGFDAVNPTQGLGSMEVEQGNMGGAITTGHPHTPKRQISNLSLPKKKSEIAGASSNLVNSIVGAGIIGIPFAIKEAGFVAGVVLLVSVSYFTGKAKIVANAITHCTSWSLPCF